MKPEIMKIIFLDIDGVMWTNEPPFVPAWKHDAITSASVFRYYDALSNDAVTRLTRIMDSDPEIRIVISSSWRIGRSIECLQNHFEICGFPHKERIIDCTKHIPNVERGIEIQEWLDRHPEVKNFVIIDDDSDMAHLRDTDHFFKTSFYTGLTDEIADKIIERLKKDI